MDVPLYGLPDPSTLDILPSDIAQEHFPQGLGARLFPPPVPAEEQDCFFVMNNAT